jgi:RNA-dependent RNA polymerase
MGVIDETGILEEKEIFFQMKRDNFEGKAGRKEGRQPILNFLEQVDVIPQHVKGTVLVTRNPCTHPGDIRKLESVFKPELAHLFNVIVFSCKGARPQQDMMSGGDLDGDEFFITWDKDLLAKDIIINEPAVYDQNIALTDAPPQDVQTIEDHIVHYMERDILGRLSNLWLAVCDRKGQFGPKEDQMKSLS